MPKIESEIDDSKPFLKWCGGKTLLAPKLTEIYKPYRSTHVWVEPFCGALGATLGVKPKHALLNDVNPYLINLHRQVKRGLDIDPNLKTYISEDSYYRLRDRFNTLRSLPQYQEVQQELAELFYYMNRVGYRGLCRVNGSGGFNVPYGHYIKPILNHDFSIYQKIFGLWQFSTFGYSDFIGSLLDTPCTQNSFVYADPPYDGGFVDYSGDFGWEDQVKLAEMLAGLDCPVIASNKASDRIIDLYQGLGFVTEIIELGRKIGGDRKPAREMFATKNCLRFRNE